MIRELRPDDIPFVTATWLLNYRSHNPFAGDLRRDVYREQQQTIIARLLRTASGRVACDAGDENVIYGYTIYAPSVLHYLYVKEAFRKMGIGRQLLEAAGAQLPLLSYTHWTDAAQWVQASDARLTYNPTLAFRGDTRGKRNEKRSTEGTSPSAGPRASDQDADGKADQRGR